METLIAVEGVIFIGVILFYVIKSIYRRNLARKVTTTLSEITGNALEPPANIKEMHNLLDYFEHVRDTGGELDENNQHYKKKLIGDDVAYQ